MYESLRWPVIVVLTLAIHLAYMPFMRLPLAFRISYGHVGFVALIVALAWLLRRVLTVASDRARYLMSGGTHSGARSLIMLAERLVKALVVVVAALAILTVLGVDTKTALAGLGIGGVALALGAQKSVENLLGGVFLLSDRALAVGDTCSIANRVGVVEDITLRSVRLRTAEQTLLSIPAGTLSGSSVENFATRAKILLQTKLHLRAATSVRSTLDRIQALLDTHTELEHETSAIRLVDFGADAVLLELTAYVLTADNTRFLAVRQDLLLQIADIVEESGTLLPQPAPQFVVPAVAAPVRNPLGTDDARLART
jgi:MscS family membrane protein